jgi:hypothetical protein
MLHGVIYAKHAWDLNEAGQTLHFVNEARSAAGSGTMLQELYVTHTLMGATEWDALAEACKFALKHQHTMVDTHWVGGDPAPPALDIYGWAAWRGELVGRAADGGGRGGGMWVATATLTLRNPDGHAQTIALDAHQVFELPEHAPLTYRLTSPYADQRVRELQLVAGSKVVLALAPFEVLSFEAYSTTAAASSA